MLKRAANIFGIAFIVAGVLGFIPGITTADGYLLGLFHVDATHNIVHILSGAVALAAASRGERGAQLYFQIFGVVYAVIAVLGIFYGARPVLGFLTNNAANVVLHFAIAAVALYFGFVAQRHGRHAHA
jgi:hypothetical protein